MNNIIEYNLVYDCGRLLNDGGLIYTLGSQEGSVIRYNYLYGYGDATNVHDAGIYLDEGSRYFEVYNNLVFDAYWWCNMWTSSIRDNLWYNNYYNNALRNNGTNNTIRDNTEITQSSIASIAKAKEFAENAGLEEEYSSRNENGLIISRPFHFDEVTVINGMNGLRSGENKIAINVENVGDARGMTFIVVIKNRQGAVKNVSSSHNINLSSDANATLTAAISSYTPQDGDYMEIYLWRSMSEIIPEAQKITVR